ncbi:Transcription factor ILI1 [Bienertia sinuspersici]
MSSSSKLSLASSRRASEGEISELIFKLQALLPERNGRELRRGSKEESLREVCSYINKLNKEVDDLSERLFQLLACTADADALTTTLQL